MPTSNWDVRKTRLPLLEEGKGNQPPKGERTNDVLLGVPGRTQEPKKGAWGGKRTASWPNMRTMYLSEPIQIGDPKRKEKKTARFWKFFPTKRNARSA